jgi:acetyl esterase/lipase
VTTGQLIPWLFFGASLWGAAFTLNAFRPLRGARRSVVSFFAGWLTTELALHHIAWQVAMTALFVWAGALAAWPGWLGLGLTLVSWAGLARCLTVARDAEAVVGSALDAGLGSAYGGSILPEVAGRLAPRVDWRQLLLPLPVRHPEVERTRNVVYASAGGVDLKLDVYRRRDRPSGCPTLLQIHGGAWILGSKNEQGIPLMVELASHGWVCVSADYRLSPRATFPDHLVDLKRAIRWIREHAAEYGADPDFLVVTGGSAGGHLAALVALTGNEPSTSPASSRSTPRWRDASPSTASTTSPTGTESGVMRASAAARAPRHEGAARGRSGGVEKASPMARVRPGAPPFFVIHGTHDTMVPVAEARHFCEVLRQAGAGRLRRIPARSTPSAPVAAQLVRHPRRRALPRGGSTAAIWSSGGARGGVVDRGRRPRASSRASAGGDAGRPSARRTARRCVGRRPERGFRSQCARMRWKRFTSSRAVAVCITSAFRPNA